MNAKGFIYKLSTIKWFAGAGKINSAWKMFDTRDEALEAAFDAGDAEWDAAFAAEWDAAFDAAFSAAGNAVWNAEKVVEKVAKCDVEWDAEWDAVCDVARIAGCLVAVDLIDKKHIGFCDEVAEIWSAGYGRAATIDGVHYVYARPRGQINEL